jgi:outer membrane protein assembly factor BamB
MALATIDGSIELWDLAAGSRWKTFTGNRRDVGSLTFTANGKRLLGRWDSLPEGYRIGMLDASSGQELWRSKAGHSPVLAADGRHLAVVNPALIIRMPTK